MHSVFQARKRNSCNDWKQVMDYIPTLLDYYDIVPQAKFHPKKFQSLDKEYVIFIRELLKSHKSIKQIAKEAKVAYHTVWNIKNKMTYTSIKEGL